MDPITLPNNLAPIADTGSAAGGTNAETFQQLLMQMASAAIPVVLDEMQQIMGEEI